MVELANVIIYYWMLFLFVIFMSGLIGFKVGNNKISIFLAQILAALVLLLFNDPIVEFLSTL